MLITLLYGWKEAPKFLLNQKKKKKNSTQKIVTVSRIAWACDLLE